MRAVRISAAGTQVKSSACKIWGIKVVPDGTNQGTLHLYDSAESTALITDRKDSVTGKTDSVDTMYPHPLMLSKGCYISLSGTNASGVVYMD